MWTDKMEITDVFHNFANVPDKWNLKLKCSYVKLTFMKIFFTKNLRISNLKVCYKK